MLTIHPDTHVTDICQTLDNIAAGGRGADGRFLPRADIDTLHKLSDTLFRLGVQQGSASAVVLWHRALDTLDLLDQLT